MGRERPSPALRVLPSHLIMSPPGKGPNLSAHTKGQSELLIPERLGTWWGGGTHAGHLELGVGVSEAEKVPMGHRRVGAQQ